MVVIVGELGLGCRIGRFTEKVFCASGERVGVVAEPGVDDDGKGVARPDVAYLFEACAVVVAGGEEGLHGWAFDARFFEFIFMKFACVGLGDPPADVVNAVIEELGFDGEGVVLVDDAGLGDGMLDDGKGVVEEGAVTEPVEVALARGGVVAVDGAGDFVEVEPHEDGAKAEAVIAVEVGDEDTGDGRGCDVGKDELTLGPLTWVEEEPLAVPAEEVGALVALASGLLGGAAEDGEVADGHLAEKRLREPQAAPTRAPVMWAVLAMPMGGRPLPVS